MAQKVLTLTATPTVTAGAYSDGDNVGGLMKLKATNPESLPVGKFATIKAIIVADKGKQDISIDVILYSSNPSGTTFTDNAAQVIADADLGKIIHVENLTTYDDFSANSVAGAVSLDTVIEFTDGIYASLVTRGAPTYASTSDIIVTVIMEYEE